VYDIELTVMDHSGNIDTDTISVTVHLFEDGEMLSVMVGPVTSEDNETLEDVLVEISFMGHSYNSTTDDKGVAFVDIPIGLVGRMVNVKLSLGGYRNATFKSVVLEDGTLEDATPEMVPLPHEDNGGDADTSFIEGILAVLIVILILVGILYAIYPFVTKPEDMEE
jgi:hypothetical protein